MFKSKSEDIVKRLLDIAGIEVNGSNPWDIQVHDKRVYDRVMAQANLGLGESYMEGWWECDQLDEFFFRVLSAKLGSKISPMGLIGHFIRSRLVNRQTPKRAWQVGKEHYDLSNEFYEAMLDSRMTYTCGYWQEAETLEQAQEHKLELICQKMKLKPGMRVLDIGCGWGSFMSYATKHYDVKCVGVTISKEQVAWAKERYQDLDMDFRLQDYREVDETFDRIVSVGMFEHVGGKNYESFFEVAEKCLEEDGLMLLHTIGKNLTGTTPDPWIDRYIFPNGELPSMEQITKASETHFVVEDVHNFGADYDKTLMAWHDNFAENWPQFKDELGNTFERMWRYYLLSCAGAFRARDIQLWQWVFSKNGLRGGYRRVS
ncbi:MULTISPECIES: cyclopropane fatty acyl phospholipid synthase [Gammaproteobacteria]|uniref:cyclopropane fatty acyl phospholipid synthase n=1 Tax=Gammaproteobacteria TaxID=1236 RepID=UPI000DCF6F4F|nr:MULTISPECIES: cyclopropane fatty acyl phospholipid synthase [Gammaproteobacteria]RTE86974.1 cyclopropane fatty acyl phospholipid synthase [Aliidiomarina sp. B3213]TCZ93236.1 cyclopropane fatty acyl phospholipid synthase [Lysobacter sp. N42]